MEDIKDLRVKIDEIDKQLLALFEERMRVCDKVGEYKKANNLPVFDEAREKIILKNKTAMASSGMAVDVSNFFNNIMEISKDRQRAIINADKKESEKPVSVNSYENAKVGYCGLAGAYSHFATLKYFGECNPKNYGSFKDVVTALLSGDIDYGVLPIENTTAGSVMENYDLLAEHPIYIVGEEVVEINHCLLGVGEYEDIKTVISHPQALFQCEKFLDAGGFELVKKPNTAISAKECSDLNDKTIGVIASELCSEIYNLKVLKRNIADKKNNATRFIIIGRNMENEDNYNKVSLTFKLPHTEGALLKKLEDFKAVNLTKIESRPIGNFEYVFYVDYITSEIDAIIEKDKDVKILGKYIKKGE